MPAMRWLYFALALAGCAQADTPRVEVDAAVQQQRDASVTTLADAAVVAPPDGPTPTCTMVTQNLLMNGSFDATPAGTGWIAAPIDSTYPIVTNDAGGVPGQSGAYRAWMGGLERPVASNKDSLYQEVAIPATTTTLVFNGYYDVRSVEGDANVYDRATIELVTTTNTQLQLIKSLDDNGETTAWTQVTQPITANVAGQTVRLRFTTASDPYDVTSFFFDTIELVATYCQ